ncbi:retron St85 family RNA-directed DNA polymerase [Colwellia psychrerythraea]|uniref:RNA-directed DNA polymerase n=1 Tax=Colwellia psychrerythraea TaxID=28229 RepID=A0A099K9A9_COLPS|nr:retron St85 family RNA-directed DNA polymerase [Colwellia psychrerythraea]KGJ87334.1 RNA-directed DNA polymerase [Colwellia psychrerythraea]
MKLLDHLSSSLLLDKTYIMELAETASQRYKQFSIPKKTGGFRSILHPARELKTLQRIIHEDILVKLPIHNSAFAYRKKLNIFDHANVHIGASYLLRMDFKNFFESISSKNIAKFLDSKANYLLKDWKAEDTELLVKLVCYKSSLTIGSVSSPTLSNAICYELDEALHKLCYVRGIQYTRYADDLYFSTNEPNILNSIQNNVYEIVNSLSIPDKLRINSSKTHHSSRKNRMSITGLILTNSGDVSIGRDMKRKIRSLIFKWCSLDVKEKKYLAGYLSFCASIEPEFLNSLCKKYGADIIYEIQNFMNK